ncbi:MAG: DUF2804 domain-containing protein [Lawsonibacter sp.]|jgi:hypothetical protein|nr:DUF2804 domain-containing protein [Lawsonibacter sp.]MCI9566898.1 DUF2804 domain-containing protein [Lawsonibacter sp.]
MEQHEITQAGPLLDEQGSLREAGYAKKLLPVYDRARIRGKALRIKEWDYYLVMNGQFALALTIADNSYMGLDSISFMDFWEKAQITKSPMRLMPMGSTGMPASTAEGDCASGGKGYSLLFRREADRRLLYAHMEHFRGRESLDAYIELTQEPEESMVICTPFDEPGCFYLNQKINCLRASGKVTVGEDEYMLDPDDSFGVLDWSRGVWPYHDTWYWASASGLSEGIPFGFNLGYGFGDTAAATENMLFYDGKAHKLSKVRFKIPGRRRKRRYMEQWEFTSDDGRFEMRFAPILERSACSSAAGIIKSDQHQVFGKFTGLAILDDGTEIFVKDLLGLAEEVENKW